MHSTFMLGFAGELIKTAKYPISQFLTSRVASGATGAGLAAALGGTPAAAAALGGRDMAFEGLRRILAARGMAGRIARGGRGMTGHEKKRLAEAAGMSTAALEKVLAHAGKKGGASMPVSRALTWKWLVPGLGHARRAIDARGLAGRAEHGIGMTRRERQIIEQLKQHKGELDKKTRRKLLAGLGAAALGATAATKMASAEEVAKRKAKGAAKGAVIGAGTAVGLPTALTLLLARGSRGLPRARDVASLMVGRLPRHMEELRDLEKITRKITGASALTGAGVGALTS